MEQENDENRILRKMRGIIVNEQFIRRKLEGMQPWVT